MKSVIYLCMLLICAPVFALNTNDLTPDQIHRLELEAAKMKVEEGNKPIGNISATVRHEAEEWAKLGDNIGVAMVAAAKQIGMAASEFSQTGLGRIVTVIITYKIIGQDILGILIGGFILICGLGTGSWMLLGRSFADIEYEDRPWLWGLTTRRYVKTIEYRSNNKDGKIITAALIMIVSLIVGLLIIF